MIGGHHRLNVHEFEQAPGVGDGQESLVQNPEGRWSLTPASSVISQLNIPKLGQQNFCHLAGSFLESLVLTLNPSHQDKLE